MMTLGKLLTGVPRAALDYAEKHGENVARVLETLESIYSTLNGWPELTPQEINILTREFCAQFMRADGSIEWQAVKRFAAENTV